MKGFAYGCFIKSSYVSEEKQGYAQGRARELSYVSERKNYAPCKPEIYLSSYLARANEEDLKKIRAPVDLKSSKENNQEIKVEEDNSIEKEEPESFADNVLPTAEIEEIKIYSQDKSNMDPIEAIVKTVTSDAVPKDDLKTRDEIKITKFDRASENISSTSQEDFIRAKEIIDNSTKQEDFDNTKRDVEIYQVGNEFSKSIDTAPVNIEASISVIEKDLANDFSPEKEKLE